MTRVSVRRFALLFTAMLALLAASLPAGAQDAESLDYGDSILGEITADAPEARYTFGGEADDLVAVTVIALESGLAPQVRLFDPDGRQLNSSIRDPLSPASAVARNRYRLPQAGDYTVQVTSRGGTTGQFVLTLEARATAGALELVGTTPATLEIEPSDVTDLTFTLDPENTTVIAVEMLTAGTPFTVTILDDFGLPVARLDRSVLRAELTLPAGPGNVYLMSIALVNPDIAGTLTITLTRVPVEPDEQATAEPAADCTNEAEFVQDVTIPDGSVVQPGTPFVKTWRVRNTGTCTWQGYTMIFAEDSAIRFSTPITSVSVPVTEPGETADISAPLVLAIDTPLGETVRALFRIRAADGTPFDLQPFVEVAAGSSG